MPRSRQNIELLLDELDVRTADDLEDQDLDFKEWSRGGMRKAVRSVVSAAVCMANGGGGTVVFGVRDSQVGRDLAIIGVPHHVSANRLKLGVYDGTDPKLTPVFEELLVPEGTGRLILMHVYPGMPPYTNTSGEGTVRVGKDCKPLTGTFRRQVIEWSADADFTAETVDVPLSSAISATAIELLRSLAERERAPTELLGLGDQDMLRSLGVIRDEKPTRSALLLCGSPTSIRENVPGYMWTHIRMGSSTGYTDRADGVDSIPVALSRLLERIMADNPIETIHHGPYDLEYRTYPEVTLREALLNSLCHSDFRTSGPRLVRQYADRIEISSPGGFVGGITAENVLHHAPATRNPHLVDALVRLRLVNRTNLGMERIFQALLIEGKSPPIIEDIGHAIRLTVAASKLSPSFRAFVSDENEKGVLLDADNLLVLHHLIHHDVIDLVTAASLCHRRESEVSHILDVMVADLRYLEPLDRGSGIAHWRLVPEVRARLSASPTVEYDPKANWTRLKTTVVRILVRRTNSDEAPLTNADVRRITGLDRHQVRRLVHELREEGLVEVAGRGRAARYVYMGRTRN